MRLTTGALVVAGLQPVLCSYPHNPPQQLQLGAVTRLDHGEYLESSNRQYRMVMQSDGNLVGYTAPFPSAYPPTPGPESYDYGGYFWHSNTPGVCCAPYHLVLQADHNLVIYGSAGAIAIWDTFTDSVGKTLTGVGSCRFAMQDDRNFVGYRCDGGASWESSTVIAELGEGPSFHPTRFPTAPPTVAPSTSVPSTTPSASIPTLRVMRDGGAVSTMAEAVTGTEIEPAFTNSPAVNRLCRVPQFLQGATHFRMSHSMPESTTFEFGCPANLGVCSLYIFHMHEPPCTSAYNGKYPGLLSADGWTPSSCAPHFCDGTTEWGSVMYSKQILGGTTTTTPPLETECLSYFGVFVAINGVICEENGLQGEVPCQSAIAAGYPCAWKASSSECVTELCAVGAGPGGPRPACKSPPTDAACVDLR